MEKLARGLIGEGCTRLSADVCNRRLCIFSSRVQNGSVLSHRSLRINNRPQCLPKCGIREELYRHLLAADPGAWTRTHEDSRPQTASLHRPARVGDPRGMGDLRKQVAESKHDEAAERRLKSEELAAELRQITSDWQNDLTFQARRSSPTGIYQLRCHRQSSVGSAYGFTDGGPFAHGPASQQPWCARS